MLIKQSIKKILQKLHLYNFAVRIISKSKPSRVKTILKSETKFSFNVGNENKIKLHAQIRLVIHTIEKMTVKNKGSEKFYELQLTNLYRLVSLLIKKYDYSLNGDAVVETIGITDMILSIVDSEVIQKMRQDFIDNNNLKDVKPRNINISSINSFTYPFNFEGYSTFVKERHSIREFENRIVEKDVVKDIVNIAKICPSECNRQTCKVYYTKDQDKLRKLYPDPIVTKDIYNMLIITVDKSSYSMQEVLQPWIDGGIFAESMIMAIHAKGLGACLFQCIKETKRYESIKQLANIPKNEDIVCFVGFGYLKDSIKFISTHRKDTNDILLEY